jgi:hypothetical protein
VISHSYKCICVAQRKVASTSIAHAFGIPWKIDSKEWHYANGGASSLEWYQRPKNYFTFSFVRNPWDRLISGWLYCPQTQHLPLRTLLQNLPTPQSDPHGFVHITRLQRTILTDNQGKLIVDFLGRFENLQSDFNKVCAAIAMKPTILHRQNECPLPRRHYREYFTDPIDRELFFTHFKPDIETFHYEF